MFGKRRWEQAGCQRGDQAVAKGGRNANPDEGEHVRAAVADRLHAALEERPAGPQHDWCGQDQLDPGLHVDRQRQDLHVAQHDTREVLAEHGQHERHHSQRKRPPEPAREVAKFRIVIVLQARHFRLQRHAAEGTVAWTLLPDFRVHRAGVDGAGLCHLGFVLGRQIALRIGHELRAASLRAEVERCVGVGRMMLRRGGIDLHATDRIGDPSIRSLDRGCACRMVMVMGRR